MAILVCRYCGRHFNHRSSLHRHSNTRCAYRPRHQDIILHDTSPIEDQPSQNCLRESVERLCTLVREMDEKIKTGTDTSHHNVHITNNTTNITINQFGREDISHLSRYLDLDRILYRTKLGLVQLVEYIHFRHRSGTNKNVRVSNIREEMLEYHNGQRWLYGWRDDILNKMMDRGIDVMSDHFDNEQDRLRNKWTMTMYDHVEGWLNDMQERKDEAIYPAAREVFRMLCNNTADTKGVIEKQNNNRCRRRSI